MKKLFHPLLEMIANAAENELAAIIQHLKEENRILRDKLPKRIQLTDEKRQRLVKTGTPLGSAIKEIITIVHHRTFQRWVAAAKGGSYCKKKKSGRPRTPEEIRELVVKIASETGWGPSESHRVIIRGVLQHAQAASGSGEYSAVGQCTRATNCVRGLQRNCLP